MMAVPLSLLGGAAGGGLTDLAGGLFSALDTPRRLLWNNTMGVETGDELMDKVFGLDTANPLVKALSIGSEMALDPLNLVGAGMGSLAGRSLAKSPAMEKALLNMASRRTAMDELAGAKSVLGEIGSKADELSRLGQNPLADAVNQARRDATVGQRMNYRPEVLNAMPNPLASAGDARMLGHKYSRVDPELAARVEAMGLGYNTPDGLVVYGRPDFAEGRGGKMFASALGRDDPLAKITTYEDTLTAPFPRAGGGWGQQPTFAELAPDSANLRYTIPGSAVADPTRPGRMLTPDQPIGLLPLDEAMQGMAGKVFGLEQQLAQSSPSTFERLLSLLGY